MPLIYDAEYQKELEAITRKAASGDRQVWWGHLLATTGVLEAFKAALVCGFRPLWDYALRDQVINTRFCVAPLKEVLSELDEYDAEREAEELERRWVLAHS